jgi:hypothetical protein
MLSAKQYGLLLLSQVQVSQAQAIFVNSLWIEENTKATSTQPMDETSISQH